MAHDPMGFHAIAPSYRQIIDPMDWSNSLAVLPPGQSENMASLHYNDQLELWLNGDYHPMLWKREEIKSNQKSSLMILPE